MVCGLLIVLVRGEACVNADRDGDGDCRFLATYSDEGSSRIPRTLFPCRMDRLWHLGGPQLCPAIREIECKTIRQSSTTAKKKSTSELMRDSGEIHALCILFKAKPFAIHDSIPPSRAALDTNLWAHGCHRTAGRCVFITGGYQPTPRAIHQARLLKDRRYKKLRLRSISHHPHHTSRLSA